MHVCSRVCGSFALLLLAAVLPCSASSSGVSPYYCIRPHSPQACGVDWVNRMVGECRQWLSTALACTWCAFCRVSSTYTIMAVTLCFCTPWYGWQALGEVLCCLLRVCCAVLCCAGAWDSCNMCQLTHRPQPGIIMRVLQLGSVLFLQALLFCQFCHIGSC
jgi:hypothetical protein